MKSDDQHTSLRAVRREDWKIAPMPWRCEAVAVDAVFIALGSFKSKTPPEIRGTGYSVRSLEAALWAFFASDSFEEGALLAVNLGEDADTTGAVYGELAGVYYGDKGIPEKWRSLLAQRELIEDKADRLFELAPSRRT